MRNPLITAQTILVVVHGIFTTSHADFSKAIVHHQSADQLMRVRGLKERWGQVEVRTSLSDPTWYPVCYNASLFYGNSEQKIANWACQTRLGLNVSYAEVEYGQPLPPDMPFMRAECPYRRKCSFSPGTECSSNRTMFIYCPSPESRELSLRLTGGQDERRGRLEMMRNGEWGFVCGEHFSLLNARVACRQMGFDELLAHKYSTYELATGNSSLARVRCIGDESRLIECFHMILGLPLISCRRNAIVECRRRDDYSPRLGDSKNFGTPNGRLDVKVAGQWGALCGTIPDKTIRVACREMALPRSSAGMLPLSVKYPSEKIPKATVEFRCRGSERRLSQCRLYHGPIHCNETFGIVCSDDSGDQVRLVGGDNNRGRLEIKISGIWGTVCNTGNTLYDRSAEVVCRSLGFINKTLPLFWPNKNFRQAPPEQPVWPLTMGCYGWEDSLKSCRRGKGKKNHCSHTTDVAISCKSLEELNIPIRLVGGRDDTTGRLEIFYDGQWGTVCRDFFGHNSASVACRQLGLPHDVASRTTRTPISHPASGPVWLNKLRCRGDESHIIQCPHTIMPNCDHSKDVILKCGEYTGASSSVCIVCRTVPVVLAILLGIGGCYAKKKYTERSDSAGGNDSGLVSAQYRPGNLNSSADAPDEGVTLMSNHRNTDLTKTSAAPPSYSDLFWKGGDSKTTPHPT